VETLFRGFVFFFLNKNKMGENVAQGISLGDTSRLTAEERWGVLWTSIMAYYSFDSILAILLSFVGMIALAVSSAVNKNQCESPLWIPALLAFLTRITDVCIGSCALCYSGPPTHEVFGKYVKRNFWLAVFQTLIGSVQLVMGVIVLIQDECPFINGILACIFGGLFICESGVEIIIWTGSYYLWKMAQDPENNPPEWVDDWIPDVFKHYLRNGSPLSKKTNRKPVAALEP